MKYKKSLRCLYHGEMLSMAAYLPTDVFVVLSFPKGWISCDKESMSSR